MAGGDGDAGSDFLALRRGVYIRGGVRRLRWAGGNSFDVFIGYTAFRYVASVKVKFDYIYHSVKMTARAA